MLKKGLVMLFFIVVCYFLPGCAFFANKNGVGVDHPLGRTTLIGPKTDPPPEDQSPPVLRSALTQLKEITEDPIWQGVLLGLGIGIPVIILLFCLVKRHVSVFLAQGAYWISLTTICLIVFQSVTGNTTLYEAMIVASNGIERAFWGNLKGELSKDMGMMVRVALGIALSTLVLSLLTCLFFKAVEKRHLRHMLRQKEPMLDTPKQPLPGSFVDELSKIAELQQKTSMALAQTQLTITQCQLEVMKGGNTTPPSP